MAHDQILQGVGIGLRKPFAEDILHTTRRLDWLEITPENWMFHGGWKRRLLDQAAARWPIVPHSVSLDLGGISPLDEELLEACARLADELDVPFWSDHVCFSSVGGHPTHDLLPLPFTREAVENLGRRARVVQARIGRPLVLENATFYAHMPGAEMDEADFVLAVQEASGCELLLDVNNVYVNSLNHGFDPYAFMDRMPMDKVRYLHLAGHTLMDDVVIDTHIGPVIDPVWDLYRHTLTRAGRLIPTLIEWDQDIPPVDVVIDEADRARCEAAIALAGQPG